MASQLRVPIRIIFYREDDVWLAHCLEFDLIGDGQTREEALQALGQAIAVQVEASIKYGNLRNLFTPADGRYFQMYAAGKDATVGSLDIHFADVSIGDVQAREYEAAGQEELLHR